MTALIGIGSVHPGQGRVSAAGACRPTSSNKSAPPRAAGAAGAGRDGAAPVAGLAGAGFDAAGFAATGFAAAALSEALAGPGTPPGIFSGFWQPGHLTVLPANSSLAANAFPQAHCTLIGMRRRQITRKSRASKIHFASRPSCLQSRPATEPNYPFLVDCIVDGAQLG